MSLFNIVQVAAGSVPTAPTGTYIVFLDSADGILKKKDDAGVVTAASPGEVNTASNVGSGSGTEYGVFKQKTGVDLELKKIKQGANITLTENLSDITIAAAGTDLGSTGNGTSLTVSSSTGTNASVPAATTSAWGAMTDEDKTKLDGIAAAAQPGVVTTLTTTGSGASTLVGATLNVPTPATGDTYYSQKLDDTTGGTIDAPYGTPVEVTSTANFYITVAETGSYIIHGSVNIDNDLNKDNNALELVYGIDTGSGATIATVPYQQNMQGKKNKRNGIQGTWINVSLTAGDKVHMFMSTCDDSCTWLDGRIFIATWK